MSKKRRKGGIGAKFFAAVLTAALTFSNVSMALPGGMTLAEEETLLQTQTFSEIKEEVDTESVTKDAEAQAASSDSATTEASEVEAKKADAEVSESEALTDSASEGSVVAGETEELVEVKFELQGISDEDLESFKKDAVISCIPEDGSETKTVSFNDDGSYSVKVKKFVTYALELTGVDNYKLLTLNFEQMNVADDQDPVVLSFEVVATENTGDEVSEDTTKKDRNFDAGKADVWDFGAEDLGDDYNNRLDADTINGFYGDVAAGSTGVNIASFSVDDGDFEFNDGGYSSTHRLRTANTELTRYDAKSLKDSDGNVYNGYIYSNKGSTDGVYVALECEADDTITAFVASNGTDSEVHFRNVDDASDDVSYVHTLGSSTVSKMTFYPSSEGKYKLFSATEKLVLARVIREHAQYSTLTGTVNGYNGKDTLEVLFTNKANGNVVKAEVSDGAFAATLAEGFEYELSLEGADDYAIVSPKTVSISGDESIDLELVGVELVNVSGKLTGIAADDVENFVSAAEFTFEPQDENSVYVPKISLQSEGSDIYY
ncbi:MAG: hypothetical protein J6M44_14310, partial [Butyrivibrio sp.]|nr:hypothetical protein [Butyrivibrio sp.]